MEYMKGNSLNFTLDNNNTDDFLMDIDPYELIDVSERLRTFLSRPHIIIMLTLGSIAIAVNLLSLIALFQVRNRMNSHFRLIISLSVADTLVGASIILNTINRVVNPVFSSINLGASHHRLRARCLFMVIKCLHNTALCISLLNLLGMSVDHFVAIIKPLHYPKLMNDRRIKIMISILWVVSFICGYSVFLAGIFNYSMLKSGYNYCEAAWESPYEEEFIVLAIALICCFVMLFIYIKIYRTVSNHRIPGEQLRQDERKNRRALITTLLIVGSFMLCWLPMCLFQIAMIIKVISGPTAIDYVLVRLVNADKYLYDLLLLNTICDPIIYTVRTKEVRLGYKRLFSCLYRKSHMLKDARAQSSTYTTASFLSMKRLKDNKNGDDVSYRESPEKCELTVGLVKDVQL